MGTSEGAEGEEEGSSPSWLFSSDSEGGTAEVPGEGEASMGLVGRNSNARKGVEDMDQKGVLPLMKFGWYSIFHFLRGT